MATKSKTSTEVKKKKYNRKGEFEDKIAIQPNRGGTVFMLDEAPELIEHIDNWLDKRQNRRSLTGAKRLCDILAEIYPDEWTPSKGTLTRWLELNRRDTWDKVKRMKSI